LTYSPLNSPKQDANCAAIARQIAAQNSKPTHKRKTLNSKQQIFTEAFMSGEYRYMFFGGAMGGGKSYLVIGLLIELCQEYPEFKCVVLRKSRTTLESTSLETAKQVLKNQDLYDTVDYHETKMIFTFPNGSRLRFQEADRSKDKNLDKLRGLEENMVVMEEANEMEEAVFHMMITRLRHKAATKIPIPRIILLTANPANNWVKTTFYDPWAKGILAKPYYYLPALPHENEFLDQDYLDTLEYLPRDEYERNVLGNWNFAGSANQLIEYQYYIEIELQTPPQRKPTLLGIDVAREGNDSTVGTLGDMQGVIGWDVQKIRDFNANAEYWLQNVIYPLDIKSENVLIDACGLGCGLVDAFAARGFYVGSFKSSEKAKTELKREKRMPDGSVHRTTMADSFADAKAESSWFMREDIHDGIITIPYSEQFRNEMFIQKYQIKNGKIVIEEKYKIKKENNNKSPDVWDSTVIFNYLRRNNALIGGFSMGYVDQIYKQQMKDEYGIYSRKYYNHMQDTANRYSTSVTRLRY